MVIAALSAGACWPDSGFGQIDRHAFELGHRQRRDHEKDQQKENRVDHRDDLDARFFNAAALNAHQCFPAWFMQQQFERGAEVLHPVHFALDLAR